MMEKIRPRWRSICIVLFVLLVPAIVVGRITLIGNVGAGFRSLTRNFVVLVLAGAVLGVPGIRIRRSSLAVPLLTFLAAVSLATAWNNGHFGEVRLLVLAATLFVACRALVSDQRTSAVLFHWLGLYVVASVAAEVITRPELLLFQPWLRDQLVYIHPNTLGGILAILLPLFVAAAIRSSHRLAACVYALASLIGIGLSFSRAAWLAAAVGAAVFTIARRRGPRRAGALAAPIGGLLATGLVAGLLSIGRSGADWQRLRILETSLSLFREHWLLGIGYGIANLSEQFPPRYVERYGQSLFLFHSHNLYVDLLVGTGLVGAAAGLWLLWRMTATALETRALARSDAERNEAAGYVTAAVLILFLGLTDSLFYHSQVMVIFGVLWALIEARVQQLEESAGAITAEGASASSDAARRARVPEEIAAAR